MHCDNALWHGHNYFLTLMLWRLLEPLWSSYYCVLRHGKIWLCSEMRLFWLGNTQILCFSSLLSETTIFICPKIELAYIQEDFVLFCHVFDLWSKKFLKIKKVWFYFAMEFLLEFEKQIYSIFSLFIITTCLKMLLEHTKWSILMPNVSIWQYKFLKVS